MASPDVCLDCSRTVRDTGYIGRGQDVLYVTYVGDCYFIQRLKIYISSVPFISMAAVMVLGDEHVS